MSTSPDTKRDGGTTTDGSEMDPPVATPGSGADPSTAPDWEEHVHGYFNQDAVPGEANPSASHEAKDGVPPSNRDDRS